MGYGIVSDRGLNGAPSPKYTHILMCEACARYFTWHRRDEGF